jgi:hypothetical protein
MDTGAITALIAFLVIGAVVYQAVVASRRKELARVRVEGAFAVIEPVGIMKLLALTARLEVRLAHMSGVFEVERPQDRYRPGMRLPGTWLPGLLAGTFQGPEGRSFWLVGRGETSVRLDLDDEHYDYIVIDVADPSATLGELKQPRRP